MKEARQLPCKLHKYNGRKKFYGFDAKISKTEMNFIKHYLFWT